MTSGQVAFQGRRFRVERLTAEVNGSPHVYDVVRHPGAAVILPVLDDGRIVLIWNYRPAVGAELLELPAGTLDPGEDPAACALRELAEETGYRAARVALLLSYYSSPGIMDERLHAFLATGLTPGATACEAGEQIRVCIMTLNKALAEIDAGRLVDAKTLIALQYYARHRAEGGPWAS